MKRVLIFGGTGHMGAAIRRHMDPEKYRITTVTRNPKSPDDVRWDGQTLGPWAEALEGADVVINLAGRRVHCRYNEANLQEMMSSRILSTQVLGTAIAQCSNPPSVWLQASTATIYAHTFGQANDEATGELGGSEPGVPKVWNFSIQIAKNWEAELEKADTPNTRKVPLRTAIMMGIDKESAFDIFSGLTRMGLGGQLGSGRQFVSWVHEQDMVRAMEFIIEGEMAGPVNICAPNPLPQAQFAKDLRRAWGIPFGLPAMPWMINIGAWVMNGDSELVMKSRRVVPTRLLDAGFKFNFPDWAPAAKDLAARMQHRA
jgi:uncharacterized protein (TIGR01777 family)